MKTFKRSGLYLLLAAVITLPLMIGTGLAQGWGRGMHGNWGPNSGYGMMGRGYMGYGHMRYGMMRAGRMGYGYMGYGRNMMGYGQMGWVRMLPQQYQLTQDQQQAIQKIQTGHQKAMQSMMQQYQNLRADYYNTLRQQDVSKKELAAKRKTLNDLEGQLDDSRVDTWQQIRKVLTPEQQKYLAENNIGPGMGWGAMMGVKGSRGCGNVARTPRGMMNN